ncbi:zeta toxin family protein [Dyadobacter sp.]|uniref:zeta toxin family protein n=1 Tax=Dyadobacter sp. TaxID=1914288 RepID=UPI003F723B68
MPELFVITGPNGAGKSVLSTSLLPDYADLEVFDGDKTFYKFLDQFYKEFKVSKYAREKAGEELIRTFERLVEEAIAASTDLAYEGHFSEATSWRVIQRFRSVGYRIHFIFLSLQTLELSFQRIATRVIQSGHYVPPIHIRENFYGNLKMLDKHLHLIDNLKIIDNSGYKANVLLTMEDQKIIFVKPELSRPWRRELTPNIFRKIEDCC